MCSNWFAGTGLHGRQSGKTTYLYVRKREDGFTIISDCFSRQHLSEKQISVRLAQISQKGILCYRESGNEFFN